MNYNFKKISRIASEALNLAEKGDFGQAEMLYRDVILQAEQCGHHQLSDFYHQLATVLSREDSPNEAFQCHEKGLSVALKQSNGDNSDIGVALSRYFLGEQLLTLKRYDEVLNVVAPSLGKSKIGKRLLPMINAISLWKLDRKDEARVVADNVINSTPSEEQKHALSQRFNEEFK